MRTALLWTNVAVRALVEVGLVAALAAVGWSVAGGGRAGLALAVLAPAAGFGFWGAVDFRGTGRYAASLRLGQELLLCGLAALGLYAAGLAGPAWALAAAAVGHHALRRGLGQPVLPRRTPVPA